MRRSKFSLSHYNLITGNMGYLYPLTWYEALPGDSIQQSTSLLLRASPLLAPIMHPVRVRLHHWFVPLRLIWEDFEEFITGGPDGTNSDTPPYYDDVTLNEGNLSDYLGLPPATYASGEKFSMLPHRAYALIWNENYRDQDLETATVVNLSSGRDTSTSKNTVRNVCWEKDYFTTARDEESKGDEITIPLTGDAPITGIGASATTGWGAGPVNAYETDGSGAESYADYKTGANMYFEEDPSNAGYPNIRADLSTVSGVTINDLRLALAIQRYQEARNRYGSRYVEYLRYLGVRSSDARLSKPEYLGGGRQTIQFSEVLYHAEGAANPVGYMTGHGISALKTNRFRRFFEEHGIVMTLLSVVPKAIYSDGVNRKFQREVKEDYYQRELVHLGDQEVLNSEVYVDAADYDGVFGYQSRYDEYRKIPSNIAGEFRSTMDHWHLARIFGAEPSLNSTFVNCSPSTRIFADEEADQMYIMASHSIQARRLLPAIAKPRTF